MYPASFVFAAMAIVAVVALLGGLAIGRPWGHKEGRSEAFRLTSVRALKTRRTYWVRAMLELDEGRHSGILRDTVTGEDYLVHLVDSNYRAMNLTDDQFVQFYYGAGENLEFELVADPNAKSVSVFGTI